MKITSKKGRVYDVFWQQKGYTYTNVVIKVQGTKKYPWGASKLTTVWDKGCPDHFPLKYQHIRTWQAETMLKEQMQEWFQLYVDWYEDYQDSWTNSGDFNA